MEPIKITFGNRTYNTAEGAFDALNDSFSKIQKELGELTPVFNKISPRLVDMIKQRFDTGELNEKPYSSTPGSRRSRFTKQVRRRPSGPTLKDTGRLQGSISRLGSPTKSKSGGQREVSTLRIGSRGVPYAEKHLFGGEWQVPVFKSRKGKLYIDYDKLRVQGKTNSSEYGSNFKNIRKMQQTDKAVEVPMRDFLLIDNKMVRFVRTTVTRFVNQVLENNVR